MAGSSFMTKCNLCQSSRISEQYLLQQFNVLQCRECSLVFLSMQFNDEDLKELYSSDYYQERQEYYFNNSIANPENGNDDENIIAFGESLRNIVTLKPDKGKLLDVGCGLGIFLYLARQAGWETCGVDISPYAARYAREKFGLEVYDHDSIKQRVDQSGPFDVITLWDSIEHFPDPLGMLKQINSYLQDDGLLMLNTPNEESLLRYLAKTLYTVSGGLFTYPVRKLYHTYHLYYFNLFSLKKLLSLGGFEILSVEKKRIPIVKARGSSLEKTLVRLLSNGERILGKEYELEVIARKAAQGET
jgi:2-polyprenyl-3-methyl-5-hydroxy-6-metoxy-1,4-benzoquinol methylase